VETFGCVGAAKIDCEEVEPFGGEVAAKIDCEELETFGGAAAAKIDCEEVETFGCAAAKIDGEEVVWLPCGKPNSERTAGRLAPNIEVDDDSTGTLEPAAPGGGPKTDNVS
jgi:hypothetical protein